MTKLFRLQEWVKYQFIADNAYNLHSPFLYDFWQNVLQTAKKDILYQTDIFPILKKLYADKTYLNKHDLGTGNHADKEKIARVARTSSVRPKYGHVLHQIVKYYKPNVMIELGTCFGISTRYLLHDFEGTHFYSIEGSPARYGVAFAHLENAPNKKNLILMQNSFEQGLSFILDKHHTVDLVFIDGNHTFEATLQYFNALLPYLHAHSIIIFDDIHWSKGMLEAWRNICQNEQVRLTVDIFQFGICFFNPALSKENKVLRY